MKQIIFGITLLLGYVANSIAGVVYITPPTAPINVNSIFSVAIQGNNFTTGLDGGSLTIAFNPSVLQLNSMSINSVWDFSATTGTINNVNGTTTPLEFATFTPASNFSNVVFDIATLTFKAVGVGTSYINLGINNLMPFAADGNLIQPTFSTNGINNLITVTNVPVRYIWFLYAGIMVILFTTRRRNTGYVT